MITGILLAIPIGLGTGYFAAKARLPIWVSAITGGSLALLVSIIANYVGAP